MGFHEEEEEEEEEAPWPLALAELMRRVCTRNAVCDRCGPSL